jgi:signal transduction histidine kinase
VDSARRFERRLLAISAASGALFLAVLAIFAFLIFQSLSSRLTANVLEQSRADAESIARRLAAPDGPPNLRVTEKRRETEMYLHSVLQEKRTVQYITVTDREGRQLFEGRAEGRRTYFDQSPTRNLDLPDGTGRRSTTSEQDYDIAVPIENIGFLHVGVSKDAITRRLELLRADLIRKTAFAGGFAILALALADVLIWRLLERNRKLELARTEDRRLSELGVVASGLAHEIRNPLHALGLSLQNLQARFPAEKPRFDLARSEVRRLDRLVTDFLEYARPAPLRPETFSLADFLAENGALASYEARERGVRVETAEGPDREVSWDRGKVRQVVWNLLRNAVEASVPEADGGGPVRLEAEDLGDEVVIRVTDRGPGIAPEHLSKIPSLFFTTKKGGSGLGLMVASRIVRDHGGRLEISSKPGRGTQVAVRLPGRAPAGKD